MRRIGVVTVARSDYGIYRPLLRKIEQAPDLELALIVAGMHLVPEFGNTIEEIIADGFTPASRVDLCLGSDTPGGIARAMGLGTIGFAQAYEQLRPDILVVLGDRFEMHAAAAAAVPFLIPIAHLAGGALTGGAIDDAFRHSITKLASLHFVETELYGERVRQMGEEPWRVHVTGSLGLDNLGQIELSSLDCLNRRFGLALEEGDQPLLVTFHPVTREFQATRRYVEGLLAALAESPHPVVFTYPNADTNGRLIIDLIEDFSARRSQAFCVPHFGTQGYYSLMAQAGAMVGNSSSGIIEAASFRLPVVNIGSRQKGRLAAANVVHTGCTKNEILDGIRRACAPEFRQSLDGLTNPYGDGMAAPRMIEALSAVDLFDPALIQKEFQDNPTDDAWTGNSCSPPESRISQASTASASIKSYSLSTSMDRSRGIR